MSRFAVTTDKEFSDAIKELKKKGMKNLIVDLQGNGGGFLTSAIAMADEFLDDGQSIVYTEGRRSPRDDAFASKRGQFQKGKLVLLVDESSASASEILSGAIQDWKICTLGYSRRNWRTIFFRNTDSAIPMRTAPCSRPARARLASTAEDSKFSASMVAVKMAWPSIVR